MVLALGAIGLNACGGSDDNGGGGGGGSSANFESLCNASCDDSNFVCWNGATPTADNKNECRSACTNWASEFDTMDCNDEAYALAKCAGVGMICSDYDNLDQCSASVLQAFTNCVNNYCAKNPSADGCPAAPPA